MFEATIEWGTVGEWVGGLAAAGGLVFAGIEIRRASDQRAREEQQRREDELESRTAMARAVGVSAQLHFVEQPPSHELEAEPNSWKLEYEVYNGGTFPIHNAVLMVRDSSAYTTASTQRPHVTEIVIGTVLGGKSVRDTLWNVPLTEEPMFSDQVDPIALHFTDTWGQSWWRDGPVLEERDHPARTC